MTLFRSRVVRWAGGGAGVVAVIAAIVATVVWHQRVLPQKTAIAKLHDAGATCLYDFEYDFQITEERIPNYQRASTPSPILRMAFGTDWVAVPVYVQFTGDQIADRDVAELCDLVAELPTVRHLNLRGTLVSDKSGVCLARLQQLRVLDVRESKITRDGKKSLEELLPACRVLSGKQ